MILFPPCTLAGSVTPNGDKRFCYLSGGIDLATAETCGTCRHGGNPGTTELVPICDASKTRPTCVHRREQTRTVGCAACGGRKASKPVYGCVNYGECTEDMQAPGLKMCVACPDYEVPVIGPIDGPTNIIWFVYPRKATSDIWESQQAEIAKSIHKFDGHKFCAIATDETTDESLVRRDIWDEVVVIPNDQRMREVPGWLAGMHAMSSRPGVTVWLHGKGAVRGAAELHLQRWWEIGYRSLLDVDSVRKHLEFHAITGVFRRHDYTPNLGINWHYSGTFYAFRNDKVFQRDWLIPFPEVSGWYAEAWPALAFSKEQSGCLAYDGVGDLYQSKSWREVASAVAGTR